jgi:arylsulfatase A-like enzyme
MAFPHSRSRAWRGSRIVTVLAFLVAVLGIQTARAIVLPRPSDAPSERPPQAGSPPNIIFILADDLGSGELGAYGQKRIRTPRLDRLAAEGMRFTQFYSGSTVCAPSRGTFLTGRHTGHAYVRDNHELGGFLDEEERGQMPLPTDHPTVARWLRSRGYATAVVGKWGLGGPGSTGVPTKQGFDSFFGYLDQKQAHNYYPTHLWRNETAVPLRNTYFSPHQKLDGDPQDPRSYARYRGVDYAIDAMSGEAVSWLRGNASKPFFLYFAPTIPHLALQVPDAALKEYEGAFPETPYTGDNQYLPQRTPRAAYAAMITYLDAQVGRILDTLRELGLEERTIVMFSSDNGATFDVGGAPTEFFESNGKLRGHKTNLYEGGIRVPLIARWPGHIRAGTTSDHVSANWDMWATFADLVGAPPPEGTDGISILPTLVGRSGQREHRSLYWEFHARGASQAVRMGRWKGIRNAIVKRPDAPVELYDLDADPRETTDVSASNPGVVRQIEDLMRTSRTRSHLPAWNFGTTAR